MASVDLDKPVGRCTGMRLLVLVGGAIGKTVN